MPILQTRGPNSGACNICGDVGPLTEDHTPPKGFAKAVPVRIAHLAARVGAERIPHAKKSPDGVKYRSLCKRCNNSLLGGLYDQALIDFSLQVEALATSELVMPSTVMARIKPQRVARSVLGHLAAQGIDRFDKGAITNPLRDYILDPALPMLPGVRFCYWLYPFRSRVLIRDAAIMQIRENVEPSMIWVMKCFPLAFAILWQRDFRFEVGQPRDFDAFASLGIDDPADVPVDLVRVPHEYWPESPTENTMLMIGQEAVTATVSPARGRVLRKLPKAP